MISVADDLQKSKIALVAYAQADLEPTLSTGDIERLLQKHQRFGLYSISTLYNVNDRVVPTTRTGRVYKCTQSGTSDVTEPVWYQTYIRPYYGQIFMDGDPVLGVIWSDDGPDDDSYFDITGAAHDAWLQKAARLQQQFNVSSAGQSFALKQQYDNALSMAALYSPQFII